MGKKIILQRIPINAVKVLHLIIAFKQDLNFQCAIILLKPVPIKIVFEDLKKKKTHTEENLAIKDLVRSLANTFMFHKCIYSKEKKSYHIINLFKKYNSHL